VLKKYSEIEHKTLEENTHVIDPFVKQSNVTLDSPALEVMTDFQQVIPATITPDLDIESASSRMKSAKIRLLFVTNEADAIIGLITATDLFGEAPVKLSQELRIPRNELKVAQIMTSFYKLTAIPFESVEKATVGNIVKSLDEFGRQHTLVLGHDKNGNEIISGMFSNSQIGRQLGLDVEQMLGGTKTLTDLINA